MTLTEQFNLNGLIVIRQAIDGEAIDRTLNKIEIFKEKNIEVFRKNNCLLNDSLQRVVNLHLVIAELRALLASASSEAGEIVGDYLGDWAAYTSLYFERGSEQPLHRDTPYFWTSPPYKFLGFWIALEDIHEFNGPLRAIEGSHKMPELDLESLRIAVLGKASCPSSHDELFNLYNKKIEEASFAQGLQEYQYKIKKGDVIIWHPQTIHGGSRHLNIDQSRKSLVFHLKTKDVPVKHMDYFFHQSERQMPEKGSWKYFSENRIEYVQHESISMMHKYDVPIKKITTDLKIN
jgi:ectoine hydroxylase-related dioxygenase (phytanoyl-CoA dioxygenase family)